jgi:hypothetical protein
LEQIPTIGAGGPDTVKAYDLTGVSRENAEIAIWRRSLTFRIFGVTSAIELLVASAYVSQVLGWVMLLIACVLLGASVGSFGLPYDTTHGLRQHRQ